MVDTLIRLFESSVSNVSDWQQFNENIKTLGLGGLPSATSCTVTESRNNTYELKMEYPVTGVRYSELRLRRIIVAKPNPYDSPQAFRIYCISKPMNGIVTVNAEHISYDLSGYPVSPFATIADCSGALGVMKDKSVIKCPFNFYAKGEKATSKGSMEVTVPKTIKDILGGSDGSILDSYGGGEYEFNNMVVNLYKNRGKDRGVIIRYGKNLTDFSQEDNSQEVYTGVYPYYNSDDTGMVEVSDKIVELDGVFDYQRILILDLSNEFDSAPSVAELRSAAESYIEANRIGVPTMSLSISFVPENENSHEYLQTEEIHLCDTVTVINPMANDSEIKEEVTKTEYNVLTGMYNSIELGNPKTDLTTTLLAGQKKLKVGNKRRTVSTVNCVFYTTYSADTLYTHNTCTFENKVHVNAVNNRIAISLMGGGTDIGFRLGNNLQVGTYNLSFQACASAKIKSVYVRILSNGKERYSNYFDGSGLSYTEWTSFSETITIKEAGEEGLLRFENIVDDGSSVLYLCDVQLRRLLYY